MVGVRVEADNPPARCDSLGEQFDHANRSAPEIDRLVPGLQSRMVHECCGVVPQFLRLSAEPIPLRRIAAKGVHGRVFRRRVIGRFSLQRQPPLSNTSICMTCLRV